jgi:hypothetical protein
MTAVSEKKGNKWEWVNFILQLISLVIAVIALITVTEIKGMDAAIQELKDLNKKLVDQNQNQWAQLQETTKIAVQSAQTVEKLTRIQESVLDQAITVRAQTEPKLVIAHNMTEIRKEPNNRYIYGFYYVNTGGRTALDVETHVSVYYIDGNKGNIVPMNNTKKFPGNDLAPSATSHDVYGFTFNEPEPFRKNFFGVYFTYRDNLTNKIVKTRAMYYRLDLTEDFKFKSNPLPTLQQQRIIDSLNRIR